MGRAIVRRPQVFLFDEPLSNLDAGLRAHMRVELGRLHRRLAATMFHVTHDQVEAMTLADRIIVLDKGVVQQIGTPKEIYETPANVFVAQFVGTPTMAMLPAHGSGDVVWLDGTDGSLPIAARGKLTVGVRPVDVRIGPGPFSGRVDVVEALGDDAYVHLVAGKGDKIRLIARTGGSELPAVGAIVPFAITKAHPFDVESGRRLAGS